MNKIIKIGIILSSLAIVIGLSSPLFYETEINEPLPQALDKLEPGLTFEKFTNMNDSTRKEIVKKMPELVKQMIMDKAATSPSIMSEGVPTQVESTFEILKSGSFQGLAGHQAQGIAKIIQIDEKKYLRFENFDVTNGPDLRVYITDGVDVKKGIHLDKLKGSKGNQNYLLENIELEIYDSIVIYCQPFGVYFGKATLN